MIIGPWPIIKISTIFTFYVQLNANMYDQNINENLNI